MKDRHFFEELLQPQIPNDGEDDDDFTEILMDESISNEVFSWSDEFNPFQPNFPFLYLLKTSENFRFPEIFNGV